MKVLIGANPMGLHEAIAAMQTQHPHVEFVVCPDRSQTAAMIGDADVYMGWLNRDTFLAAKQLKWIQSPSSGVNHFLDVPELAASDVLLTSASGTHAAAVAESTMAMILAFTRGIRAAIQAQPSQQWQISQIRPTMIELTGSTMGIIGCGDIGRALAKRAKAFEMRVIAVDLNCEITPDQVDEIWPLDRLDDLMAESDFVAVLLPYTAQTANMIGAAQLAKMKPTAMIVPMSRGGIVNQEALIAALKEKRIAAAALDVCEPEPLPADNELWTLENVLLAPHIAGGTQHEGKYVLDIFTENLGRFLRGQLPLRNQVNKQAGF